MIERTILKKILPWIDEPKIIIIKGPRQVGKTTLLTVLQDYLKKEKNISNKQIIYISADTLPQPPYIKSADLLIKYLKEQYNLTEKKLYVFIDEFQYIKAAGIFMKNVFDQHKENIQLFLSGSSSLEISKNSEFLTGRKIEFQLYPLSIKEYITYNTNYQFKDTFTVRNIKQDSRKIADFLALYQNEIDMHVKDYMTWGGYPEIALQEENEKKKLILKEIVNTYLQKDIISFLHIENIDAFNKLAVILADQIGNLVNHNELSNTLGLSNDTIKKYITILEGTYVIRRLKPFYSNIRKELSKMPKVYFTDLGLRNTLLQKLDSELIIEGARFENLVFTELAHELDVENIYFYRTLSNSEIDFIIKTHNELIPIEVKYSEQKPRKPIVMANFSERYRKKSTLGVIITKNQFHIEKDTLYLPQALIPFMKWE